MHSIIATTLISGVLSAALIMALLKIAANWGWVSRPNRNRWSTRVVVLFGGVPILLAYVAAVLSFADLGGSYVGWLTILTVLMGLVGFLDDLKSLPPKSKLLLQLAICGTAVATGVVHPLSSVLWINRLFTLIWLVGITNALNLLDNMDGLAAGVAVIALLQMLFMFGTSFPLAIAAAAMLGAVSAFLVFNFNPARVFMGDAGSLPIGFFLGCTSVRFAAHLSGLFSTLLVPTIILFLPLFDTFLVSVTRVAAGRAVSHGAKDHSSHRLVLMGMSERKAVMLLYVISATAAVGGYLWKHVWAEFGAGILALFLIASTLFWLHLAKLQLPHDWVSERVSAGGNLPAFLETLGQTVFPVAVDSLLVALGLYLSFVIRFESLNRALYGQLLFGAALSISTKLPLLHLFGAFRSSCANAGIRILYPVFQACGISGVILFTLSCTVLPWSKTLPPSVVVADFFVTSCLLTLASSAEQIFRDVGEGAVRNRQSEIPERAESAASMSNHLSLAHVGPEDREAKTIYKN